MTTCSECAFWDTAPRPRDTAASGVCVIGRLPGLVPSYCETAAHCVSFTAGTTPPDATAEAADIAQQSLCRGLMGAWYP